MAKVSKIARGRKKRAPRNGRATTEPVVISRPYLAPLGVDKERLDRIGAAVKKLWEEKRSAKVK